MIRNRRILGQAETRRMMDAKVRAYLTRKVRESFPDDFWLIEEELDEMIDKYGLKEPIIAAGIRLAQIKSCDELSTP